MASFCKDGFGIFSIAYSFLLVCTYLDWIYLLRVNQKQFKEFWYFQFFWVSIEVMDTKCKFNLHITSWLNTLNSRIIFTLLYNIMVSAQNGFLYKEIYNKDFKVMAPLLTFTQRDFLSSSQKPVIVLFFSYCVF